MKEDWESHGSLEMERFNQEPWHHPEFNLLSRTQQNTEIYKVLSMYIYHVGIYYSRCSRIVQSVPLFDFAFLCFAPLFW